MKKLIPFAALTLFLYSCTKSGSSENPVTNDSTQQIPEVAVPVDVYVGCTVGKVDSSQAAYWKDGTMFLVSERHYGWFGQSVYLVGNDIYVSGGEFKTAGYWKNGEYTGVLTADFFADAVAMAFVGTDRYGIYNGGNSNGTSDAGLYKNDQLQMAGRYKGIVISGSDIYLYGTTGYNGHVVAAIWKNGVLQQLAQGSYASFVNGLAVLGNDTYACGYETDAAGHATAHYWKNGKDSLLSDGSGITMPNQIAVSAGGNVYMCGYEMSGTFQAPGMDSKNVIWKNGARVDWNIPAGTINIQDMAVNGPDVYLIVATPTTDPETYKMQLWKNGALTTIGEEGQHVSANHITLVKK